MPKKLYVVMSKNWSYDDESYTVQDGGDPVAAYTTFEKAEAVAVANTAALADGTWFEKFDGWDDNAFNEVVVGPWERFAGFLRAAGIALPFHLGRPEILDDKTRTFRGEQGDTGRCFDVLRNWWEELTDVEMTACAPFINVTEYEVAEVELKD